MRIRPAGVNDVEFLTDVVMATTYPEETAEPGQAAFRTGFAAWTREQVTVGDSPSQTCVIEDNGAPIGRLRVVRTPEAVELAGIQLLPAMQGRGIGTRIISDLVVEAHLRGVPITLSVEKGNDRARALYSRLGFTDSGSTGDEYLMTCAPSDSHETN